MRQCLDAAAADHEDDSEETFRRVSLKLEEAQLLETWLTLASGQIRLRRIDGWPKIATVLRQQTPRAA